MTVTGSTPVAHSASRKNSRNKLTQDHPAETHTRTHETHAGHETAGQKLTRELTELTRTPSSETHVSGGLFKRPPNVSGGVQKINTAGGPERFGDIAARLLHTLAAGRPLPVRVTTPPTED